MRQYAISYKLKLSALLLFCGIALSSCNSSDKEEDQPFSFLIKTLSINNEDITPGSEIEELTLFFYDENDHFMDKRTMTMTEITTGTLYSHYYENQSHVTVVGWGNTGDKAIMTIEEPETGAHLSDLIVRLLPLETIAQSRQFILYHGIQKILPDAQYPAILEMKQVSGTFIIEAYSKNTIDQDYRYSCKVSGSYNTFDHKGEITGEPTEYTLPLNQTSDIRLQSQQMPLFPGDIKVELYKNDEWILSQTEEATGFPLRIIAGHQTVVYFELPSF